MLSRQMLTCVRSHVFRVLGCSLQVRDVSGMTASARRLVHSMNRRETQQRVMMYSIGLLLVVGVMVAVYYFMK